MTHPHLELRGRVHWYRRRIPLDLVSAYGSAREIRHSLRTSDRKEAVRLARLRSVELDNEFERKRRERAALEVPQPVWEDLELTSEQIRRLCLLWQRSVLETDDANRIGGFIETDFDDLGAHLTEVQPALRQALARGQLDVIAPALHNYLFLCRVRVDEASPAYRQLQHQFLQTIIQTVEAQQRRLNGEVVQTETVAPASEVFQPKLASAGEHVFGSKDLYDLWEKAGDDRPLGTTSAFETAARQFGEFVRDLSMRQVTRKHVLAFRDKLREDGMKPKTIETKMALLCAMFQVALDAEIVDSNPASRIKVPQPKIKPVVRLPYGTEDLLKIFTDPIYNGDIPKAAGGAAGVWLPALGLYTGARLEELAQLLASDVLEDPTHGWYLNIIDLVEDEGSGEDTKGVKTPGSRRWIPVHPDLIKAGFLRYVRRVKEEGEHRLFPVLRKDRRGNYSGNWSKWWGRYSRKRMGITSRLRVFHSLRHTFKQACREAGIAEEVHDALTGHRGGGVGRSYGERQFPLGQLVKAMKRIRFTGVLLPLIEPGC